jgi:hypothetical protein
LFIACGGTANPPGLTTLCDPASGPMLRWMIAEQQCVAPIQKNPAFTANYMEHNCRGTYEQALAAGTIKLASQQVLDACATALAQNACTPETYKDWRVATLICQDLLVGTKPTGMSCSMTEECAGDSYCQKSGTCGMCTPRRAVGGSCKTAVECTSGLCGNLQCLPGGGASGSSCALDGQCATGLICRENTCAARSDLGAHCVNSHDCDDYKAGCSNDPNNTLGTGRCTAVVGEHAVCSPWSTMSNNPHCDWAAGIGCVAGTCAKLLMVADGKPCGFDVGLCSGTSRCVSGSCVPLVDIGGLCNADVDCGPYALCSQHACTFTSFNQACTMQ